MNNYFVEFFNFFNFSNSSNIFKLKILLSIVISIVFIHTNHTNQIFANQIDQNSSSEDIFITDLSSDQVSDVLQSIDDHPYSNIKTDSFYNQFGDVLNDNNLDYSSVGVIAFPAAGILALSGFLKAGLRIQAPVFIGLSAAALSAVYLGNKVFNDRSFSEFSILSMVQGDFDETSSHSRSITYFSNLNNKSPDPFPKQAPFLGLENDQLSETDSYKRGSSDALLADINQDYQVLNKLIVDSVFLPSSLNSSKIAHLKELVTLVLSLSDDQIRSVIEKNIKMHLANDKYKWILDEKVDSNLQSLNYRDLYLSQDYSKWNQQSLRKFLLSQVTTGSSLHFLLKYFFDLDSSTTGRVLFNDYRLVGEDGKVLNHLLWSKRIEMLKLLLSFDPQNYDQRYGPLADDDISIEQLNLLIKTISDAQLRARINAGLWSVLEYRIYPQYFQPITSQSIIEFIKTLKTPGRQYFFVASILQLIENSPYGIVDGIEDSMKEESDQLDGLQLDALELQVMVDFFNFFDDSGLQLFLFKYHQLSIEEIIKALQSHPTLAEGFEINENLASAYKLYVFTYLQSVFFNLDDSSIDDITKTHQLSKPEILYQKKVLLENIFQIFFPNSTLELKEIKEFAETQSKDLRLSIEKEFFELKLIFDGLSETELMEMIVSSPLFNDVDLRVHNKFSNFNYQNLINIIENSSEMKKHIIWSVILELNSTKASDIARMYSVTESYISQLKQTIKKDMLNKFSAKMQKHVMTLEELLDKFYSLESSMVIEKITNSSYFNDLDLGDKHHFPNFNYENIVSIIDQSPRINKHIILSIILNLDSTTAADIAKKYKTAFSVVSDRKKRIVKQMIQAFLPQEQSDIKSLEELIKIYQGMPQSEVINRLIQSQYLSHLDLSNKQKYPNMSYRSLTELINRVNDIRRHIILSNILKIDSAEVIDIRQLYSISPKFFSDIRRQVIKAMEKLFAQTPQIAYKQSLTLPQLQSIYYQLSNAEVEDRIITSSFFKGIDLEDRIKFPNFNRKTLNRLIKSASPIKKHVIFSVLLNLDANRLYELSEIYSVHTSSLTFHKKAIIKTLLEMFGKNSQSKDLSLSIEKEFSELKLIFDGLSETELIDKIVLSPLFNDVDLHDHNKFPNFNYQTLIDFIENSSEAKKHIIWSVILELNSTKLAGIARMYSVTESYISQLKQMIIKDMLNKFSAKMQKHVMTLEELLDKFSSLESSMVIEKITNSSYFNDLDLGDKHHFPNFNYENIVSIIDQSPPINKHIILSIILNLDFTIAADIAKLYKTSPQVVYVKKKRIVQRMIQAFSP